MNEVIYKKNLILSRTENWEISLMGRTTRQRKDRASGACLGNRLVATIQHLEVVALPHCGPTPTPITPPSLPLDTEMRARCLTHTHPICSNLTQMQVKKWQ